MTTIAFRDGILAADSAIFRGTQYLGTCRKIARRPDGVLVGQCGGASDAFMDWALAGMAGDPSKLGDCDVGMIVRPGDGRIEVYEQEGRHFVASEFYAIGSGGEIAVGAMAMGATAIRAVEIAADLDAYTRRPIEWLHLGQASEQA